MKIKWLFLMISFATSTPQILVSLKFDTEAECMRHQMQRAPLKGVAVGCVAVGE